MHMVWYKLHERKEMKGRVFLEESQAVLRRFSSSHINEKLTRANRQQITPQQISNGYSG